MISLAMIVRNEERALPRCLGTVARHVDEIVVVDTGSTDDTREIARSFGAKVVDFTREDHPGAFYFDDEQTGAPGPYARDWIFGDFAAARNLSFDLARGDVILWLDADDIVCGDLRAVSETLFWKTPPWGMGIDSLAVPYRYRIDGSGAVVGLSLRERLVRRDVAACWHGRCHEVYGPVQAVRLNGGFWVEQHKVLRAGDPHRNLKIMLRELRDRPDDSRTLFYTAQEWTGVDDYMAESLYERYLSVAMWDEERCEAYVRLGKLAETRGDRDRALGHYARAVSERPDIPSGHLGLARVASEVDAQEYLARAEACLGTARTLPHDPSEITRVRQVLKRPRRLCGEEPLHAVP